jgi:DNA-binding transcriptional ArsR family regulator
MGREGRNRLRDRIIEEMSADYSSLLEKNLDLAKQFMRLGREGKVDVLARERLTGKEQILLYLIGKLYAKEAGLAHTNDVGNQELTEELDLPRGSLLPWLKELREKHQVVRSKRGRYVYHSIPASLVEETLTGIDRKLKGGT